MTQVKVFLSALVVAAVTLVFAAPTPALAAGAKEAAYAEGDMVIGAKDAAVTIIEYASMTCPHCANFHLGTFKELKAKYIDTGKVRMIFREFPFDSMALHASMLARCAGEDRYFGMLNVLFKSQMKWAKAQDPAEGLGKVARLAGFSQAKFKACMTNQTLADMIIKSRMDGSKEYNVDSTPSFIVNGEKTSGNMTIEKWDELLAGIIR
ncbi:MAG: DsbA family protein [Rhodospirillaceae bacterium]|jgi:protein-disulfide isomerase|nr:DsbA family protein [Rhodospirillaceae bacterium]MBT4689552.1 DsbA family protein [Rhodospirillaceae bacterium]MBT5080403.1 DsbA family protein [Rhodospirillaceae bacterium]MBT5523268.1 DsbA family protein [Rhodospirillaceae bacterium]MBT5878173.1 DsbA family protein [Rhodospirillaceae bacterium]